MATTFTLCFCGTDCWTDEGIGRNTGVFGTAGYIPVKVHQDIRSGPKAVIPGPGAPYWERRNELRVPNTNLTPTALLDTALGHSVWDLAGHAAAIVVGMESTGRGADNLNASEDLQALFELARLQMGVNLVPGRRTYPMTGKPYQFSGSTIIEMLALRGGPGEFDGQITKINLIGHSRGAVTAILCAHELEYLFPNAQVNIFAIDPVPGAGYLPEAIAVLPANVKNYVAVYAMDEVSNGFNGVVPKVKHQGQLVDPLELTPRASQIDIPNYHLIYAPGRHSTVAGNTTNKGDGVSQVSNEAGVPGRLVNHLARACLIAWGTDIPRSPGNQALDTLRSTMTSSAALYRAMRDTTYDWTLPLSPTHLRERCVTSTYGLDAWAWGYLENYAGEPPVVPRSSTQMPNPGLVKWQRIEDIAASVFQSGFWPNDVR